MVDLLWYYHWLRAMNSAEILHRLRSLARIDFRNPIDRAFARGSSANKRFAPECEVQLAAGLWQVVWNGGRMSMKLAPQITWSLIKGASDAGWISESFGVKRPAFSLCGALKATLPFRASVEIEIG